MSNIVFCYLKISLWFLIFSTSSSSNNSILLSSNILFNNTLVKLNVCTSKSISPSSSCIYVYLSTPFLNSWNPCLIGLFRRGSVWITLQDIWMSCSNTSFRISVIVEAFWHPFFGGSPKISQGLTISILLEGFCRIFLFGAYSSSNLLKTVFPRYTRGWFIRFLYLY